MLALEGLLPESSKHSVNPDFVGTQPQRPKINISSKPASPKTPKMVLTHLTLFHLIDQGPFHCGVLRASNTMRAWGLWV